MPLTKKQIKNHLKDGSKCPVCKSEDIVGEPIEIEGNSAWQPVSCSNCSAQWHDIYTLTGVELVEDSNENN